MSFQFDRKPLVSSLILAGLLVGCSGNEEKVTQPEAQPVVEPVEKIDTKAPPAAEVVKPEQAVAVQTTKKSSTGEKASAELAKKEQAQEASAEKKAPTSEELTDKLFAAIDSKDQQQVEALLNEGASLEGRNANGETPLMVAARTKNFETYDYLVSMNANVIAKNNKEETVIDYAIRSGKMDFDLLNRLLDNRRLTMDVNRTNARGESLIYLAVRHDQIETVDRLIRKGANINAQKKNGATPLIRAAYDSNHAIADLLLRAGANANIADNEGWTPIFYTGRKDKDDPKMTELLLDNGAKVLIVDQEQQPPFQFALENKAYGAFEKMALKANLMLPLPNGNTILHEAIMNNDQQAMEQIIALNGNINARGIDGWTPLMIAVNENNTEAAKILIEKGAMISVPQKDGWTALHISLQKSERFPITEMLVKERADIGLPTRDQFTPLMLAAVYGNLEAAKLLIEEGASVNRMHPLQRKNAAQLAAENEHAELAEFLKTQ